MKKKVRYLRTDNGGEYESDAFRMYCQNEGITRHLTASYTPEQNGVAERLNRTLLERARSMLSHSGLPAIFWAEAVNTAAYLLNLSPHSALDFKTPFELVHSRPATYSGLRIFGCDAYAHIPSENRKKLDPKAQKCVLVGYQRGTKGYRLWNHATGKLVVSRDVSFNEPRSMKEGESQAPQADKGKSPLPDMVEGEIIREVIYDMP